MKYLPLLLLVTLLSACQKPTPTAAALNGRMDAADSISNSATRDDALTKLAAGAAAANDLEVTTKALERINNFAQKDQAEQTCATLLAKQSETRAAAKVAGMINSIELRDRTPQAVAKGP